MNDYKTYPAHHVDAPREKGGWFIDATPDQIRRVLRVLDVKTVMHEREISAVEEWVSGDSRWHDDFLDDDDLDDIALPGNEWFVQWLEDGRKLF